MSALAAPLAVVGVDMGTTSVKAVSYDVHGTGMAAAEVGYPLDTARPDRAEQDPDRVADAALEALARVARATAARGADVAGVAFSSAMHGLMALDRAGRPLTPLVTFADSRAAGQADRVARELDGLALYARTGTPIHPMAPLAKLLWFREHEPDVFGSAATWLSGKEYLLLRLFGDAVVDHSVASATGLFNLTTRDWDDAALDLVGVPPTRLPTPVPTTHLLGGLPARHAARLGLPPGTPVVVGAGDGVLANLGVGALAPDVVACSIGTSGAARVTLHEPRTDPEGRTFCYVLTEDRWVAGGAISNGGIVLRWLRDALFPEVAARATAAGEDAYDALVAMAADVPPGAGGLLMLPYLTGERAPHWTALPRGVLFGLRRNHGQPHVVRAALEGVVFQLHSVVRLLASLGSTPSEYRATGGFAGAPLWRQIMADVFGRPLAVPEQTEGSAFGAALLGMTALGLVDSLEGASDMVRIRQVEEPIPEHVRVYARLQPLFERVHESLRPAFAEVADLQSTLDAPS